MKINRRKTVLGLGALATGSGAVFSSASFNNSVNPSSDMRVVVDEDLLVEPGILFRDGSGPNDTVDPSAASTLPNSETLKDQSSNPLFGGNDSDGLDNIGVSDLPAAAINKTKPNTDTDLFLETAVALGVTGQIGDGSNGVIQVTNETNDSHDIAIRFSTFGPDGDGDTGNDDLTKQEVVETFKFKEGKSGTPTQISTDDATTTPQTVDNLISVDSGETVQVFLDYDTAAYEDAIADAADISNSPFQNQTDTVNLVDQIKVGIEDGADVS